MRLDDGMLGADRAADAGEGDVEAFAGQSSLPEDAALQIVAGAASTVYSTLVFNLVDALADLALWRLRRSFQPEIVDLREHAVLARHPAIAESLPFGFVAIDSSDSDSSAESRSRDRRVQRRRREIRQFRNGVHVIGFSH